MTEEEYKIRLDVATKMSKDAADEIQAHLAGLALDALNEQWERSQAADTQYGTTGDRCCNG